MPTYDYRCDACNHDFSAMHKISDAAPPCPQCGGAVRKKVTAPAVL
ncbi:FmdB family zinc ribbon protein, partial [Methylogaea oryzae]